MSLHTIKRTSKRSSQRIGRGQSSGRGKTSGRGGKGQTARAGNKRRPELRDIIKKLPKRRGYGKNRARTVNEMRPRPIVIQLARIEETMSGEVSPKTLIASGLLNAREARSKVKIVGNATVSKKFAITGCLVTGSVRATIEKAGGTVG